MRSAQRLFVVLVVCSGCIGTDPPQTGRRRPVDGDSTSVTAGVDPEFRPIATDFSSRLKRYRGHLAGLRAAGGLSAEWSSESCDMFAAEVIDLLISVDRGHQAPIEGNILGKRTCGGVARMYRLSGHDFERYRQGEINDADVLTGID